jgi:anti-anti-sigma regulatory factor
MKANISMDPPLVFEGDLTIQRAVELKELILDNYKKSGRVQIAFGKTGDVDLSFLQLLCSLHRQAIRDKRPLGVTAPVPDKLVKNMKISGFERSTACAEGDDADCIWKSIMDAHK